eukprot:g8104.t2
MNVHEFARNHAVTKVLCDFYLHHEHEPQKALDLCLAVRHLEARLGQCCFQLGLLQESENQLKDSLLKQEMIMTVLELARIHIKQDQPNGALALFQRYFPSDVDCLMGKARIHELLGDTSTASAAFKEVLVLDQSNIEALACLAAHAFHSGEPQIALSYYRRILQMGVNTVEVWNNLGLCCLQTGRYELTMQCFNQALKLVKDSTAADVWYNIGHLGLATGDLDLAEQAFALAVYMDSTHSEALNNLGVLKSRQGSSTSARSYFEKSRNVCNDRFEAWLNGSIEAMKEEDLQTAFALVTRAIEISPDHTTSKALLHQLMTQF